MRPPLRVAPYQPAGCQGSSAPTVTAGFDRRQGKKRITISSDFLSTLPFFEICTLFFNRKSVDSCTLHLECCTLRVAFGSISEAGFEPALQG